MRHVDPVKWSRAVIMFNSLCLGWMLSSKQDELATKYGRKRPFHEVQPCVRLSEATRPGDPAARPDVIFAKKIAGEMMLICLIGSSLLSFNRPSGQETILMKTSRVEAAALPVCEAASFTEIHSILGPARVVDPCGIPFEPVLCSEGGAPSPQNSSRKHTSCTPP